VAEGKKRRQNHMSVLETAKVFPNFYSEPRLTASVHGTAILMSVRQKYTVLQGQASRSVAGRKWSSRKGKVFYQ
jgi:hypothetical protein